MVNSNELNIKSISALSVQCSFRNNVFITYSRAEKDSICFDLRNFRQNSNNRSDGYNARVARGARFAETRSD